LEFYDIVEAQKLKHGLHSTTEERVGEIFKFMKEFNEMFTGGDVEMSE